MSTDVKSAILRCTKGVDISNEKNLQAVFEAVCYISGGISNADFLHAIDELVSEGKIKMNPEGDNLKV